MPWMPEKGNPRQRAKLRMILIFAGVFDLVLAVLFLGWGTELPDVEPYIAWIIAGGLAFGGFTVILLALTVFGPKRDHRAVDENKDGPVIRR